MKFQHRFLDSYDHYQRRVGCGKVYGFYRALYRELRGKDPKKWRANSKEK